MTTGEQSIHLVSGETLTYTLSFEERVIEALGEVPETPSLTDVIAFCIAAHKAVSLCQDLDKDTQERAVVALHTAIDAASVQREGIPFFPHK
jgi:hypothetical protein